MMDSQRKKAGEKIKSKSKEMRKKVKNAESTALKRYKIEQYILEDLGKVLNDVYCSFQPVPADYDARKDLVKALNAMAMEIYGNSEKNSPVLEAYGSFVTDMFSRHSDLDVSINFGNKTCELSRDEKLEILGRFAEKLSSLEGEGFVRNVVSIFSARVPIVKFFDHGAAVECDLSVDNKGGILNSEIIRIISQIDDRFQKLCVLVKQWAKAHEVNSSLFGTLNSVSITLLVALHLQTQNPPILPAFSTLFRDGMDPPKVEKRTEKFLNWGQRNKESLGRLFATFFIKLQSLEFLWRQGLCVSVMNGLWIHKNTSKKRENVGLGLICVEDFTDLSQNVARRVSHSGFENIYSSINRTIDDIIEFLNGEVSIAYFRRRLFGQQAVVERHPPVLPLIGEIVGTHIKHSLVSQQAVVEPTPPVPLHNGNVTETDRRDRFFGKQAIMEPPPPLPSNGRIAGTHLNHRLYGQPAVVEPPSPVPRYSDKIGGTHLRHRLFGQPAAVEHHPPVLSHGSFGQPPAMERPPPVPSLNVNPQQPHNNYRNGFSSPPEEHHDKRVCLENGYRAVDGMAHSREEERIYKYLRNRYAGNYNTFEEFREVPGFGIHNNHSGDPYRQVPLNSGANGHLVQVQVHDRHDGQLVHDRHDGHVVHDRHDGHLVQVNDGHDGHVVHDRHDGHLVQVNDGHDGQLVQHRHDGQLVQHRHDGQVHHRHDGQVHHRHDGHMVQVHHRHDGQLVQHRHDGQLVQHRHDGQLVKHRHDGHVVHHRHDGTFSGEEQMPVSHWQDSSGRIGLSLPPLSSPPQPLPSPPPPPPSLPPPLPSPPPYGRDPCESFGPKFREPPYIRRPFYPPGVLRKLKTNN